MLEKISDNKLNTMDHLASNTLQKDSAFNC